MKVFPTIFSKKNSPTPKKKNFQAPKKVFRLLWFFVGLTILFCFSVAFFAPLVKATKALDYFDYVSELRSNVLTVSQKDYSLRVYALEREYPYVADGVRREMSSYAEIHFSAPSGDRSCKITFNANGKTFNGEMSYDNVKGEYFYSASADLTNTESLAVQITYGDETLRLNALTVKKTNTLSPRELLGKLQENEKETFASLTDGNAFIGEIYLRLICEDEPYYYVGLITKDGKIRAYLLTADTGKVLAKRES